MDKKIPIIDGGFKPSMADVSLMMDKLQILAEAGDQDADELLGQVVDSVFRLEDIWHIVLDWDKFKKEKQNKEKLECKDGVKSYKSDLDL